MFVSVVHHFAANLHIFFKSFVAPVNHHARETLIDTLLAKIEAVAMVQMDGDGDIRETHRSFNELFQINGIGVLAGPFGDLEDDRGFFFFTSLDDGLKQIHIVNIESAEGIFSLQGLGKKIPRMCQWHSSYRYQLKTTTVKERGIIGKLPGKESKIIPCPPGGIEGANQRKTAQLMLKI